MRDGAGEVAVEAEWDVHWNPVRRWCPLGWVDPPEHVADCRRTWRIWRDGLAALVPLLTTANGGAGLRRFVALGPALAARPWGETLDAPQA